MNLMKWQPYKEFEQFFNEENYLPFFPTPKVRWDFAVDVYEEKGNVVAEMNLPGFDPKELEIKFQNGYLKIEGKREEEKETKDKNYYFKEIKRGFFERKIQLPVKVKEDKFQATFKHGMLKIVVPKLEEEKATKINISTL